MYYAAYFEFVEPEFRKDVLDYILFSLIFLKKFRDI